MLNVIREYLVALGFHVDVPSLNTAQHAMETVEKSVSNFSSSSVKNFAIAGAGVTTFLVAANAGLGKFVSEIGQADLQTQIFARRMWMSVDNARAYQSSMGALGANLQDLYLSPELMQRYLSLRSQALQMQMPDNQYETAMKSARDMTFQFQRLKLEGTYALQWIGFYLMKYVEPVLKASGIDLKSINDTIQKTMPQWTQKIAEVASWVVRLGAAMWDARGAIAAIAATLMAPALLSIATNPIFLAIAAFTALLLLIDDYKTYESGGQSAFPKLWKSLDDNGVLKNLQKGFDDIKGSLGDVLISLGDLANAFAKSGALNLGIKLINSIFEILAATLESVAGLITEIAGVIHGLKTGDWSMLAAGLKTFSNGVPKDFMNALNEATSGGKKGGTTYYDKNGKPISPNDHKIYAPSEMFPAQLPQIPQALKPIPSPHYSGNNPVFSARIGKASPTAFHEGYDGTAFLGYDPNASWPRKIYDLLTAYLPHIASGVKVNKDKTQKGLTLTDFAGKMQDFLSNNQPQISLVNYSPWSSLYPSQGATTHNATQVSLQPVYNIYGAREPNTTAKAINTNETALLTRAFRGVQM